MFYKVIVMWSIHLRWKACFLITMSRKQDTPGLLSLEIRSPFLVSVKVFLISSSPFYIQETSIFSIGFATQVRLSVLDQKVTCSNNNASEKNASPPANKTSIHLIRWIGPQALTLKISSSLDAVSLCITCLWNSNFSISKSFKWAQVQLSQLIFFINMRLTVLM